VDDPITMDEEEPAPGTTVSTSEVRLPLFIPDLTPSPQSQPLDIPELSAQPPSPTLPTMHTVSNDDPLDMPALLAAELHRWPDRIRAQPDIPLLRRWLQERGAGATMHFIPSTSFVPVEVEFQGDNVPLVAETFIAHIRYLLMRADGVDTDSPSLPNGMQIARLYSLKLLLRSTTLRKYKMLVNPPLTLFHHLIDLSPVAGRRKWGKQQWGMALSELSLLSA
jgi:hypothetical protein